jgi:hypothetical protein
MRGETPTLLGLLERGNFNHWTTHVRFTTAIEIPETRICQREITGKHAKVEGEVQKLLPNTRLLFLLM